MKERKQTKVFVPQLSKEQRKSKVFVPQLLMILQFYWPGLRSQALQRKKYLFSNYITTYFKTFFYRSFILQFLKLYFFVMLFYTCIVWNPPSRKRTHWTCVSVRLADWNQFSIPPPLTPCILVYNLLTRCLCYTYLEVVFLEKQKSWKLKIFYLLNMLKFKINTLSIKYYKFFFVSAIWIALSIGI